jgi:hypothetical protein
MWFQISIHLNFTWIDTVNREFSRAFYFHDFHEFTVKRELKTRENFNSNALTIKFLQQTRNFIYR